MVVKVVDVLVDVEVLAAAWRWKLQQGAEIDLTPSLSWPAPIITHEAEIQANITIASALLADFFERGKKLVALTRIDPIFDGDQYWPAIVLNPDEIAHSGQHVATTDNVGAGGERSMSGHVFGLAVGHREVVVDRVDDAVDAAAIGIVNGRIAWAETIPDRRSPPPNLYSLGQLLFDAAL
jgi:hypothetical protein